MTLRIPPANVSRDTTHRRRRKFKAHAHVIRTRARSPDFTITTDQRGDQQQFYRIPTILMRISIKNSGEVWEVKNDIKEVMAKKGDYEVDVE